MNNRIKILRKTLNKTQQEMGEWLGLSKSGISEIESGRRNVTEQHIIMLKNRGVSEQWLRTGEGEMFAELDREEELMRWAGEVLASDSEDFRKRFVKMLMSLRTEDWELIARMAEMMAAEHKKD